MPTATVQPTRAPLYFIDGPASIQPPTVPLSPTVIVAAPPVPIVLAPRFPTPSPTIQPSVQQPVPQVQQTGQTETTTSQPTEEVQTQPKGNNHTIFTHYLIQLYPNFFKQNLKRSQKRNQAWKNFKRKLEDCLELLLTNAQHENQEKTKVADKLKNHIK